MIIIWKISNLKKNTKTSIYSLSVVSFFEAAFLGFCIFRFSASVSSDLIISASNFSASNSSASKLSTSKSSSWKISSSKSSSRASSSSPSSTVPLLVSLSVPFFYILCVFACLTLNFADCFIKLPFNSVFSEKK